jgi:hypothetical protein
MEEAETEVRGFVFVVATPSALRAPPPAKLREGIQLRSTNLLGELSEGLRGVSDVA